MTEAVARYDPNNAGAVMERVVVGGDLSQLSATDRVRYYNEVCKSLGLNPLTKPFAYITLNGKLTLYAQRDCTDQLRKLHHVSTHVVSREKVDDIYVVTARATMPDGRTDESIGAVSIGNLRGDAYANALMKAETKAKRRVTLSIVGLGWLDETEVDSIPDARPAQQPVLVEPPTETPNLETRKRWIARMLEAASIVELNKLRADAKADATLTRSDLIAVGNAWNARKAEIDKIIETGEMAEPEDVA